MLKLVKSSIKSAGRGIKNDPEVRKIVKRFPRFCGFVKKRLTPDEKFGLYLTVGILLSAIFLYLLLSLIIGLFTQDILVMSDLRVLNIAKAFRTPRVNQFMFFITTLGSEPVVFLGAFAAAVLLYFKGYWRRMVTLLASVVFGEALYRILKYAIERSRPPLSLSLISASGYSFPSGHAFMAVAFYGLLAYLLSREIKRKRLKYAVILFFALLIGFIGYSRIYLGVHWPTDVLAGLAAGAAWITVFITALEIRRKFRKPRRRASLVMDRAQRVMARDVSLMNRNKLRVLGAVLFAAWLVFLGFFWKREAATAFLIKGYSHENKTTISPQDVPDKLFDNLPRVSETISGKPQEPINIIVIGSVDRLKSAFREAGWIECDRLNTKNVERQAVTSLLNEPYPGAPGVPSLWDALPNDFAFEKPTGANSARERHHVHFWETPFVLENGEGVWFATAHYDTTVKMRAGILPVHAIDPAIDKEREKIKNELADTGEVESSSDFQIVDPTMGKNQSGDLFFTDGKAYVIFLKE